MKSSVLGTTLLLGVLVIGPGTALALPFECGTLTASFGPFDYRTVSAANRQLVEGAHFLPQVEMLKEGTTARPPGGDIAYTLAVMPNHPRALLSMERLGTKEHTLRPSGSRYSIECYFLRAIEFARTDPIPPLIYATFLHNQKRNEEAIREASQVEELRSDSAGYQLDYNLGLLFLDLGIIDKAKKYSAIAYASGAPFPGLKSKIEAMENRRR